jgi:hypothetical protein
MLPLGQTVMTRGVAHHIEENIEAKFQVLECLQRHAQGDWGDLCPEDKAENEDALKVGNRILSAYTINGTKIWIITEWDRSVTTILFPSEY